MNHVKEEQIRAYISDELSEPTRVEIEDHIYSCDLCLQTYINEVEQLESIFPTVVESKTFIKQTLTKINNCEVEKANSTTRLANYTVEKRKKSWVRHGLVHYGVAASITLLLMSSGVFQSISGLPSTVEAISAKQETQSISESLMDKALSWIQVFETKLKEGEQ